MLDWKWTGSYGGLDYGMDYGTFHGHTQLYCAAICLLTYLLLVLSPDPQLRVWGRD